MAKPQIKIPTQKYINQLEEQHAIPKLIRNKTLKRIGNGSCRSTYIHKEYPDVVFKIAHTGLENVNFSEYSHYNKAPAPVQRYLAQIHRISKKHAILIQSRVAQIRKTVYIPINNVRTMLNIFSKHKQKQILLWDTDFNNMVFSKYDKNVKIITSFTYYRHSTDVVATNFSIDRKTLKPIIYDFASIQTTMF